jgi:hypothetical protein
VAGIHACQSCFNQSSVCWTSAGVGSG